MPPMIGVFDSGFGGLTVLRELLAVLPGADYLYFGDTARLPYGSKSAHTVAKYAISSAHFLQEGVIGGVVGQFLDERFHGGHGVERHEAAA